MSGSRHIPRRRRGAWSRVRVVVVTLALACFALTAPTGQAGASPRASSPDAYVAQWDAIGSQAFTASGLGPIEGHVIYAYAAIAEYDAVMAIEGTYEPFAIRANAPQGASAQAAVVAAAHRIFAHHLAAQAATILDPAYAASLATIPDDPAKTAGVTLGEDVADSLIELRQHDGFRAPVTFTPQDPSVAGAWQPTAAAPPAAPYAGHMQPFVLDSADQLRPDGPPALDSARWARDYNTTKEIGSATSTTRTAAQTLAARYWAEAPVQQAHGAFRRFIADHALSVTDATRFMAMVTVSFADGLIACFDAKYLYAFWRPITAIRAGDIDGNDATVGDPSWTPLLPATPNHPEYPSAHSCATPAAGLVMAKVLGTDRIDATFPSLTGLGDRHFATADDLAAEVANARVWGGIHFPSAVQDGARIAQQVARLVMKESFRRTHP